MKSKLLSLMTMILIFLSFGCEKQESINDKSISTSSLSFTECNTDTKSANDSMPLLRLIGQPDGELLIKMINTEFCCGTDSISVKKDINGNEISLEIIDEGPFTYCYCPHDLDFLIGPFENSNFKLTLIESEHAYSRDTFFVNFEYSQQIDTTLLRGSLLD